MGHDTLSANIALGHSPDARDYSVAAQILQDLSVHHIILLTNNPDKISCMVENGITVHERIPMTPNSWSSNEPGANEYHEISLPVNVPRLSVSPSITSKSILQDTNTSHFIKNFLTHGFKERDEYLVTKAQKMGHLLSPPERVIQNLQSKTSGVN